MIPREISNDVGELLARLGEAGYTASGAYEDINGGCWYVDVAGPRTFRMVKDRRQYLIVEGPECDLRVAGLWKAFNEREAFENAVLRWAVA